MKKLYVLLTLTVPFWCLQVMAQIPSPTPGASPMPVATAGPTWLTNLIASYPKLAVVVFIVGGLRLTLKPLFSFLHTFLPAWGLTSWDSEVTVIEASKPVKFMYFLIDYLGSVKVPVAATPTVGASSTTGTS